VDDVHKLVAILMVHGSTVDSHASVVLKCFVNFDEHIRLNCWWHAVPWAAVVHANKKRETFTASMADTNGPNPTNHKGHLPRRWIKSRVYLVLVYRPRLKDAKKRCISHYQ